MPRADANDEGFAGWISGSRSRGLDDEAMDPDDDRGLGPSRIGVLDAREVPLDEWPSGSCIRVWRIALRRE
jgi:hypothetical protein